MNKLREEILEAQRIDPKPRNETETREMIIRPLIEHLGYKRSEIRSEAPDPSGKIPDFTIMPETDFTWFLEAKDWRNKLSDVNATQAINYAHAMGRRWVVLTNGKEWQLYDDTISGVSSDRLVVSIRLSETELMLQFLNALRKESMQSDYISKFTNKYRMKEFLSSLLEDSNSELIRLTIRMLRKENIIVDNEDVKSFFKELKNNTHNNELINDFNAQQSTLENQNATLIQTPTPDVATVASDGWLNLGLPTDRLPIGKFKKPSHLKLPDNTVVQVKTWAELYIEFFKYISKLDNLPPPPCMETKKITLYNVIPENTFGKKFGSSCVFETKYNRIFLDTSAVSWSLCRMIHLCKVMNLPLEGFQFKLAVK